MSTPSILLEQLSRFLRDRSPEIVTLKLIYQDSPAKTTRLFYVQNQIGELPTGKRQAGRFFSPDGQLLSFAEKVKH